MQIAIEMGITRLKASVWPATYAAASTRRICSVAYAVEDRASEAKIARAVFLVSRSCAKRAVRIGLPTSRRFNEAIFYRGSKLLSYGGAKKCHSVRSVKRRLWLKRPPTRGLGLHLSKANKFEFIVPYSMPLFLKIQRSNTRNSWQKRRSARESL